MDPVDIHPPIQYLVDENLQKGRPVNELTIPDEIKSLGDKEVRKYIDSRRLAYYENAQVWYCSSCRIVCANEEVLNDGSHEKCGNQVKRSISSNGCSESPFMPKDF